jgi:hypothetical protein
MFIFERPFVSVAAGLAVPLLLIALDRCAHPQEAAPVATPVATLVAPAAPRRERAGCACAPAARWGIVRAGS